MIKIKLRKNYVKQFLPLRQLGYMAVNPELSFTVLYVVQQEQFCRLIRQNLLLDKPLIFLLK